MSRYILSIIVVVACERQKRWMSRSFVLWCIVVAVACEQQEGGWADLLSFGAIPGRGPVRVSPRRGLWASQDAHEYVFYLLPRRWVDIPGVHQACVIPTTVFTFHIWISLLGRLRFELCGSHFSEIQDQFPEHRVEPNCWTLVKGNSKLCMEECQSEDNLNAQ